jgi:FkbM family methyltransferase
VPSRWRSSTKSLVRRVTRGLGYDLVPVSAGMAGLRQRALGRCRLVVDVGANVGQYGQFLRDTGYSGPILSFEPSAEAFRILQQAAASSGSWDVRQKAIGESTGIAVLNVSQNSVSSSLHVVQQEHLDAAPSARVVSKETVEVSTLDAELANENRQPIWLKLDVQGHELAVLKGAEGTLADTFAVQTEVSFVDLYEGQASWIELCEHLVELGFRARFLEAGFEDGRTGYMQQADFLFLRD